MDATRILIVVKAAEPRAAYEEALRRTGVAYDIAGSFSEVLRMSIDNAYSGMMIDMLTLIRCSKEEKLIAYDCMNCYPSLRVKWDARQKSMNLSPLEQSFSVDTEATLTHFIESRCKSFPARSLRRYDRKEIFLNLLLSTCREFPDGDSIKTFTVNISPGGAFLHTTRSFFKGQTVWLRFLAMDDAEPIQAVVCWHLEWGVHRSIPGIGVKFEMLSEEQATQIKSIARL